MITMYFIPMYYAVFPIVYLLISPLQALLKKDKSRGKWGSLNSISQEDRKVKSYWNSDEFTFVFCSGLLVLGMNSSSSHRKNGVFPLNTSGVAFPLLSQVLEALRMGYCLLFENMSLWFQPGRVERWMGLTDGFGKTGYPKIQWFYSHKVWQYIGKSHFWTHHVVSPSTRSSCRPNAFFLPPFWMLCYHFIPDIFDSIKHRLVVGSMHDKYCSQHS